MDSRKAVEIRSDEAMRALHTRLSKLEKLAEEEPDRLAPTLSELIRQRYAAMRPNEELTAPRTDTRNLYMSEILRMRYAKAGRNFDEEMAAARAKRSEAQRGRSPERACVAAASDKYPLATPTDNGT